MATGNILRQCCRATVTNSVFFIILIFLGAHCCSSNHTESVLFPPAEGNTVHGCYQLKLPTFHGTHELENKELPDCNKSDKTVVLFSNHCKMQCCCRFIIVTWMKAINCTKQSKLMGNFHFITCARTCTSLI